MAVVGLTYTDAVISIYSLSSTTGDDPLPQRICAWCMLLLLPLVVISGLLLSACRSTADVTPSVYVDPRQQQWNNFVAALLELNEKRLAELEYYTEERDGGYGGVTNDLRYYHEVNYYNAENNRLLASIKRENSKPQNIHMIDLYIYDEVGRLLRDYSISFLPGHRYAPYETLINVHHYVDDIHSYRQYDASGELIYEQCRGVLDGERFELSLEFHEIPDTLSELPEQIRDAYRACYDTAPATVDPYTDPLTELSR